MSCRHHLAVYRLLINGSIAWHPTLGRAPERLTEEQLVERLERLPFNGCSLQAADLGGMNDCEIAEVLGITRQNIDQMELPAAFRKAAHRLKVLE